MKKLEKRGNDRMQRSGRSEGPLFFEKYLQNNEKKILKFYKRKCQKEKRKEEYCNKEVNER